MNVRPIRTRIFKEGEDLSEFVVDSLPRLRDRTVLAVTSKIVALAEGRTARVSSEKEKEALIKKESEWAMRAKYVWLTKKDRQLMANAGVDASNADGKLVLLPRDSFTSARNLRLWLKKQYRIKRLGILITDSRTGPLRAGVTGFALGYAGFKGVRDYRGKKDLFGRTLKFTRTNIADSLASAATLAMGEGGERCPLAIIEDAPVEFVERVDRKEVYIAPKDDMYRVLFRRV